jgi:hypothetical protein
MCARSSDKNIWNDDKISWSSHVLQKSTFFCSGIMTMCARSNDKNIWNDDKISWSSHVLQKRTTFLYRINDNVCAELLQKNLD